MTLDEAKRRVGLAIRALKGAPLVYDIPVPKLAMTNPRIISIVAEHQALRPDADMVGREVVEKMAKRYLLAKLAEGLEQSGAVQIFEKSTSYAIIHRATIRAVAHTEEEKE